MQNDFRVVPKMLVIPRVQADMSKLLAVALCLAGGVCLALGTQPALGQADFTVDEVTPPEMANPKDSAHRDAKAARTRCLTNAQLRAEDRANGMVWYTGYILPLMTDKSDFGAMSGHRVKLIADLSRIKNAEFHTDLISAAETYANRVLAGKYHPFARITAIQTIAHLNSVEVSVAQRVPTPYAPAMDILLERLGDASEVDAVKAVALFGIRRHMTALLGEDGPTLSPADLKKVTDALLPLVNETTPPGKRSAAGHAWMRSRAIDALAAIGEPGKNQSVYNALNAVVAEKDAPLSLRCAAANGLGLIRYPNDFKADFTKSAQGIATVAVASTERGFARFQMMKDAIASKENKPSSGGLGGGGLEGGGLAPPGGGGLAPPGGGDDGGGGLAPPGLGGPPSGDGGGFGLGGGQAGMSPEAKYPEYVIANLKRALRTELLCAQRGVQGTTKGSLTGLVGIAVVIPHKEPVTQINDSIETLLTILAENKDDFDETIDDLKEQVESLKDLVEPAGDTDPLANGGEAKKPADKGADKGAEIPGTPADTSPKGGAKPGL